MNERGNIVYLGAIVLLVSMVIFYYWGQESKTKVVFGTFEENTCPTAMEKFNQEYAMRGKSLPFYLDGVNFYAVWFPDWNGIIDSGDCRLIEDDRESLRRFQILAFHNASRNVDSKFYENTLDCPQISIAKGADNACKVIVPVNEALDFPLTEVIAELPTSATEKVVAELVMDDWKQTARYTARAVTTLVKTVKNDQVITFSLALVEKSSCSLASTPKTAIFGFADAGNQFLLQAMARQYASQSLPAMYGLNNSIISFEKAYQKFSNSDVFGTILNSVSDVVGNLKEGCSEQEQIDRHLAFQSIMDEAFAIGEIESAASLSKIAQLKSEAKSAMEAAKDMKEYSWPDAPKLLLLSKTIGYVLLPSTATSYYDEQLYITAKITAEKEARDYANYWKVTSIFDVLFSALIWGVIIGTPFFAWIKLSKKRKQSYQ